MDVECALNRATNLQLLDLCVFVQQLCVKLRPLRVIEVFLAVDLALHGGDEGIPLLHHTPQCGALHLSLGAGWGAGSLWAGHEVPEAYLGTLIPHVLQLLSERRHLPCHLSLPVLCCPLLATLTPTPHTLHCSPTHISDTIIVAQ